MVLNDFECPIQLKAHCDFTYARFTVFIYCFYFVCAVPLKLSSLRHVNLDVYNNNNNMSHMYVKHAVCNDMSHGPGPVGGGGSCHLPALPPPPLVL